jgi:isocitrate/isopropylmalate dehydrogenase
MFWMPRPSDISIACLRERRSKQSDCIIVRNSSTGLYSSSPTERRERR